MRVECLENYEILILGDGGDDSWLADDVKELVDAGKIQYIDRNEDSDLVKEMFEGNILKEDLISPIIPGVGGCLASALIDNLEGINR